MMLIRVKESQQERQVMDSDHMGHPRGSIRDKRNLKEKERASNALEASEKESSGAEHYAKAPEQKKFENSEAILLKANCLVNAGPRSPRSGR